MLRFNCIRKFPQVLRTVLEMDQIGSSQSTSQDHHSDLQPTGSPRGSGSENRRSAPTANASSTLVRSPPEGPAQPHQPHHSAETSSQLTVETRWSEETLTNCSLSEETAPPG